MEEWARKITEIIPVTGLGNSPARVNPRTGVCYINANTWDTIPKSHRLFILLHENAHLQAQSDDELLVDEIAFNQYAFAGYPLSEAVLALSRQLDFNNPEHHQRLVLQDARARKYDYYINGNKKALKGKTMDKVTNRISTAHAYEGSSYPYEDFLGFGKKARDRRKARRESRHERKLEKIEARGSARAVVAQAGGGLAGVKAGLSNLVSNIFGGGAYAPVYDEPPPPPQSNNNVWVVIVVVIVIAAISYYIWKKSKKGK